MSAMDDLSDYEMRTNALNDPGLFLDLEEDDDDVVLPNVLSVTNSMLTPATFTRPASKPPQQPAAMQPSMTSRLSGLGVPKLDVAALSTASPNMVVQQQQQQQQQSYGTPAMANSPMMYSQNGGCDHLALALGPSSQNSSPHNTTTSLNMAAFNVYKNIAFPPFYAKKLNFRYFLNQKAVPPHIENEESTGIFVGQLPSSYSEDDIEALLKAIGNEHGQTVQVRDVKSHNRDRTCAFVMINASALNAVLDFTKRVLCDITCVWVVEHSQAAQLPLFIQQMPRDQLRGVPKAALVLEKLTPQSKSRHSAHPNQSSIATSPAAGHSGGMQTNLISPLSVIPRPIFLQQQQHQQGSSGGAPDGGVNTPSVYMDGNGHQVTSLFNGSGYVSSSPVGNGLPQFFNTAALPSPATSGTLFSSNNVTLNPNTVYAMQMGANSAIRNIEAANQMMIAASRQRTNSQSYQLNVAPISLPNGHVDSVAPVQTALHLTPALQKEHCSCGRTLYLSQYPKPGTCAKCNAAISAGEVAYWCPNGHIAVCIMCALHTSAVKDANTGASARLMQTQGEMMLH